MKCQPILKVKGLPFIHRYMTVLLGMFALDYLEISFTETVKSTAPAFTVIISRLLLGKLNP